MDYLIWALIALVIVIYFIFSFVMYKKIFSIDLKKDYRVVNQEDPFFKPSYDWYQKIPKEDITITSYDNYKLKGVFIPSIDETSSSLAIVVHGYHACSDDMIAIAKLYSDLGFKVILINQRGHHGSEGTFASFGYYEKYDIKKWIEYALRTYSATDRILLHGVSMGAASIIQTTGLNIPENVRYLVLDSSFSHLYRMFAKMLKPAILKAFLPGVSMITFFKHHFFIEMVRPLKFIKKSKIPFLIIHGEEDEMVPFQMGKDLYEHSKSPYKDFYPVPDCLHGVGYIKDTLGIELFMRNTLPEHFALKSKYLKK